MQVLETVRDMGNLEYTRARLQRLTAKELATVQVCVLAHSAESEQVMGRVV